MASYTCFLTNCLLIGEHAHVHERGWTRSIVRVRLGAFDVELFEAHDLISGTQWSTLRGKALTTTQVVAISSAPGSDSELRMLRGGLMHLLTLATGSLVWGSQWVQDDGERLTASEPGAGFINYFRPTIDTHNGAAVRTFLERCYPRYEEVSREINLPVAMAYYAHSQLDDDPTELALVKSFVLLEHLKYTFAVGAGYPFIRGFFREMGATPQKAGKSRSFEVLLGEMLSQVGMTPSLTELIELRNEMLHSGLSRLPHERQWQLYEAAQDILQEYFLRMFGYQGDYYAFSSPRTVRTL